MSYSRWINSEFYTYWMSCGSDLKEEQIFMCHTGLTEQYEINYKKAKEYLSDKEALMFDFNITDKQATELQSYMAQFVADVDDKFGPQNFYEESHYG